MIGKQLRQLRKSHEMTQEQLADFLKMAKSTISQYENDINEPDLNTLVRIADLFGVSLDELIGRSDPYKPARDRPGQELLRERLTDEESQYLRDSLQIYRKWIGKKPD
ncbi:helix-turn-helix domain-containing protein [Paenibacillus mendelii]|uniref:Helix-turn-helix domain-containing protein n=1 Tax=Paenibacillus mendelii TaxID=206163 RepID=A0ABV6JC15_9BACL|nr:helix-turn-helix transcriptional regulator [Paenibacillus mendelii]MCQ6562710.1 helix-turn-helix domain-containing protein [Paenibacillus mendelii]